jgi:hypothetical protein
MNFKKNLTTAFLLGSALAASASGWLLREVNG